MSTTPLFKGSTFNMILLVMSTLISGSHGNCNGGRLQVSAYNEHKCCSSSDVIEYDFDVSGGSNDDNFKVSVEARDGSGTYSGSTCEVYDDGDRCTGSSCDSSRGNDCSGGGSIGTAERLCLVIECENWWYDCNFDSVEWTAYLPSTPSPTPSSYSTPSPTRSSSYSSPTYSPLNDYHHEYSVKSGASPGTKSGQYAQSKFLLVISIFFAVVTVSPFFYLGWLG